MSLTVDGVWKGGVWASTVWTAGVWYEPSDDATEPIRNFSLKEWRRWHKPEDERKLKRLGVESSAAQVIDDVSIRQAADSALDEQQRIEELRGELRLINLEMRSSHLRLLNLRREEILREEIGRAIRLQMDEDDAIALMLISASL